MTMKILCTWSSISCNSTIACRTISFSFPGHVMHACFYFTINIKLAGTWSFLYEAKNDRSECASLRITQLFINCSYVHMEIISLGAFTFPNVHWSFRRHQQSGRGVRQSSSQNGVGQSVCTRSSKFLVLSHFKTCFSCFGLHAYHLITFFH